jgi:hypothetical protein
VDLLVRDQKPFSTDGFCQQQHLLEESEIWQRAFSTASMTWPCNGMSELAEISGLETHLSQRLVG